MTTDIVTKPDTTTVLKDMAKGPSTNGWDVVCSYGLIQLNKILLDAYTADTGIAKDIQFSVTHTAIMTGEKFDINYDITLGAPTIQFIAGNESSCTLTMALEKGTFSNSIDGVVKTSGTFPAGYSIVVEVPLYAVYGDNNTATANQSIAFTGTGQASHITLHFPTDHGLWKFDPPATGNDQLNYLLTDLVGYFQTNITDIDYQLTSLTNQTDGASGDIIIEPISFVFNITSLENSNDGALSLYIQTKNTGNPQGNLKPSFQPGDTAAFPIPQGYDASLIFSRNFMQKVYLTPELTKDNFVEVKSIIDPISTDCVGCEVDGNYNKSVNLSFSTIGYPCDLSFTCAQDPFNFANMSYHFKFETDKLSISFDQSVTGKWHSADKAGGVVNTAGGDVNGSISLNKDYKLSDISSVTNTDISLNFSLVINDYVIDLGSSDSHFLNYKKEVTDKVEAEIKTALPSISFKFSNINFFKTTNLLFPGKQIISIDTKQGLHIPCDMVLFGNFVS
ncbi:MAG TPA: hypothetical protein VHD33_00550 [Legionellaceae bacterium]|nr:hypothetical protein [Legionellaceae bacterium]